MRIIWSYFFPKGIIIDDEIADLEFHTLQFCCTSHAIMYENNKRPEFQRVLLQLCISRCHNLNKVQTSSAERTSPTCVISIHPIEHLSSHHTI
jgi:hypothetical protein